MHTPSRRAHYTLVLTSLAAACATIVSGRTQRIAVDSSPPAVELTVEPNGTTALTPTTLVLCRNGGPYRLKFTKSGYAPLVISLDQDENGWLWGNALIGVVGVAVDFSTGAAYKLIPEEVHATLVPLSSRRGRAPNENLVIVDESGALLATVGIKD